MLTPSNIYRIDFQEQWSDNIIIPHTLIFNITQISEEEVDNIIKTGTWDQDNRVIVIKPMQIEYLQDKI